jgi:hypothetical protein
MGALAAALRLDGAGVIPKRVWPLEIALHPARSD